MEGVVLDIDDSTWFSADHHFGHRSVLVYDRRPFRDLADMQEILVRQHNSVVPATGSTVIFLGDFVCSRGDWEIDLGRLTRSLHGGRKILLMGNHDAFPVREYRRHFDEVLTEGTPLTVRWRGMETRCVHSPLEIFRTAVPDIEDRPFGYGLASIALEMDRVPIGGMWLCGHVHTVFRKIGPVVNVGVDAWDYFPVRAAEAFALLRDPRSTIGGRKGFGGSFADDR